MTIFKYKTNSFDDLDDEVHSEIGLIAAKDYGEAASKLQKYYSRPSGECDLISLELSELEDMLPKSKIFEEIIL